MSDKLVHVKAYTKDDGTKVKEHYRGGEQSLQDNETAPLLVGGVSEDVYYLSGTDNELPEAGSRFLDAVQAVLTVAQMSSTIVTAGMNLVSELKSSNDPQVGVQLEDLVSQLREVHNVSLSAEQATLEKLSTTTNQREYKELYDTYISQRESNRSTGTLINRIAYSAEHGNYDDVEKGLKEYERIQADSSEKVRERASLNMQPNYLKFEEQAIPESYPSTSENIGNLVRHTVVPNVKKQVIGGAMNVVDAFGGRDANMLWKIATDDVRGYKDYVEQNGYFVDSISDLSFDFKDTVRAKVKQQLGVDDLRGLILYPDSTLAQSIISSSEYQDFIRKSMNKLQTGEVVSGSVRYPSAKESLNLGMALGRADILDTYINKNGDIISFVLDTYDFNKGESLPIEVARNVQEHGLLKAFYSITIILVPKEQWLSWMVN